MTSNERSTLAEILRQCEKHLDKLTDKVGCTHEQEVLLEDLNHWIQRMDRPGVETPAPHGPMSVYHDHLENRQSPMPGCDCSACESRRLKRIDETAKETLATPVAQMTELMRLAQQPVKAPGNRDFKCPICECLDPHTHGRYA